MGLLVTAFAHAQDGFQISGRVNDLPAERIYLVCEGDGNVDTLGESPVRKGAFLLRGNVDSPRLAYLELEGVPGRVPLVLENAMFTLNITKNGALIQGGTQQEIFNRFSKLNAELLGEQARVTREYRAAEQAKNTSLMESLTRELEQAVKRAREAEMQLLKQYADTYVAALVVESGCRDIEPVLLKERYAMLGESARTSLPGQRVAAYLEEEERLKEGNTLPDFTVISVSGDSLSLYPVKADLKLVVFWSSTDLSCRQANVKLLDLYQKYRLKGLEIISLSLDGDPVAWKKAIELDGMFWKNGWDHNQSIARRYHARQLPYAILVDKDHKILVKGTFTPALCDAIISHAKK